MKRLNELVAKNAQGLTESPDDEEATSADARDGLEAEIDANWSAIRNKMGAQAQPNAVKNVVGISSGRTKKSKMPSTKFYWVSFLAAAAVAALMLYNSGVPGGAQNTGSFGYKGAGLGGLRACALELRSETASVALDAEQVKIGAENGAGSYALVARCPEPQFLHVRLVSGQGPVRQKTNQHVPDSNPMILSVGNEANSLVSVPSAGEVVVEVVATRVAVSSEAEVPWLPDAPMGKDSVWRQNFVISR